MGIVWCRESTRDREIEIGKDNGGSASRSFLVRVDDPTTSLATIRAQPGVVIGDQHPDDASLRCETITARSADDSGLLYTVSVSYAPSDGAGSESGEGSGAGQSIDGHEAYWGGSSSVTSEPIYKDVNEDVICNSAGDPLEGLEAERARFHLTKVTYYTIHTGDVDNDGLGDGWLDHARRFTNSINSDAWNGGDAWQWKCQGCSAKLNVDRQGEGGAARYYWEVTWDFQFKEDYWTLEPWDIGFNELVDESGNAVEVYGISKGDGGSGDASGEDDGPCQEDLGRRAIKGQDGKPVRQPVALRHGKAKAPCLRPDRLTFSVYREELFGPVFGEVTTPAP